MADKSVSYVLYLFSRGNTAPRNQSQYAKRPNVQTQLRLIQAFRDRTGAVITASFEGYSTGQGTPFTRTEQFSKAVERALEKRVPLLLANIATFLMRTTQAQITRCVTDLTECGVEIVDASNGQFWSEVNHAAIAALGTAISTTNSSSIKRGLRIGATKKASPVQNRLFANASRIQKSKRRDGELSPLVEAWRTTLKSGAKESPSSLADYLNAAGRRTAKGNPFSLNSAKNLLKRLRMNRPAPLII